jgi:hypothetical protein
MGCAMLRGRPQGVPLRDDRTLSIKVGPAALAPKGEEEKNPLQVVVKFEIVISPVATWTPGVASTAIVIA